VQEEAPVVLLNVPAGHCVIGVGLREDVLESDAAEGEGSPEKMMR
jgi:hypothetical protein